MKEERRTYPYRLEISILDVALYPGITKSDSRQPLNFVVRWLLVDSKAVLYAQWCLCTPNFLRGVYGAFKRVFRIVTKYVWIYKEPNEGWSRESCQRK